MVHWQSISTAPKHLRILATNGDAPHVAYWSKANRRWISEGESDFHLKPPLYWLPIPAPPSTG